MLYSIPGQRKLMISSESYANLEREWASVQSEAGKGTVLAIDCSNHAKLCRDLDIVSFPTIRLHQKDGTFERYRGPRRAREYAEYAVDRSNFKPTDLDCKTTSLPWTHEEITGVGGEREQHNLLREHR